MQNTQKQTLKDKLALLKKEGHFRYYKRFHCQYLKNVMYNVSYNNRT